MTGRSARPWGGLVPADLPVGPHVRERATPGPEGIDAMPAVPGSAAYGPGGGAEWGHHDDGELPGIFELLLILGAVVLGLGILGRLIGGR
jgi:hypothetical protein